MSKPSIRTANHYNSPLAFKVILRGARNNARVIVALIFREANLRFGFSKFSYLMTILEPALLIMLMLAGKLLFSSANPAFGQNSMLFLMTGVVAFRATRAVIQRGTTAINGNAGILSYGLVKPVDVIIARTTVEFAIWILILASFFIVLSRVMETEVITDLRGFVLALLMIYYFCLSLSMFNATVMILFPVWKSIWRISSLPLMMTSGVFFVPAEMSPSFLKVMIWNPFLHCVEALRSSSYLDYISVFDPYYLVGLSTAILLFSLTLEMLFRNSIVRRRSSDDDDDEDII